jgi:hypothetical protein
MMDAIEIASGGMIHLPSFVKIDTGIQEILRFYFSNLNGCSVGITDGKEV